MKYYEVRFCVTAPRELFQDVCSVLNALAGEAGFESFEETNEGVTGYVQRNLFDEDLLKEQIGLLPFPNIKIDYSVNEAEDKNWNEQWEQNGFSPIIINNKVVVYDGHHTEGIDFDSEQICIEIDARQAFGTGTHQTTRLMISQLLKLDLHGKRVIDCGTGTGILSIAALKLGAFNAVGYDIDEWSTDNARHNAIINHVDDRFNILLGNAQQVIPDLCEHFDVVMANINRNILLADMPLFVQCMVPDGHLLLSGFYAADLPLLVEKATTLKLQHTSTFSEGDWQCCSFVKRI